MQLFQVCFAVLTWLAISSSAVAADAIQSQKAKEAGERFNKAMKAARATFITDLESAAKQALAENKLDDAIRIKEKIKDLQGQQNDDKGDPVVRLRRRVVNTTWTWNRPGDKRSIRFLAGEFSTT